MPEIFSFRALQPAAGKAAQVASPPYDVVTTAEARALFQENPASFLQVSRPEVTLPDGTNEHDEVVYTQGRRALNDILQSGTLIPSPEDGLWLYAQQTAEHRQVGLVACVAVADYERDIIKKHEKTREDKEDDRARHLDALGAHDEPVFLTYRANAAVDAQVAAAISAAPEEDFVTADGVRHTTWKVAAVAAAALIGAFATEITTLYIADGHHRSAAAARVHRLRSGQPGSHDRFLAVLFPHDQLRILPYNRVVCDPVRRSAEALRSVLQARFSLVPMSRPTEIPPQHFGLFFGDQWYLVAVRSEDLQGRDLVRSLDVSLCQELLLEPFFAVVDPRRAQHLDFVGGVHGAAELERRVRDDPPRVAVMLAPTRIEQLLRVSDAGFLMPPKSTWFEPKLRSGLFVHPFTQVTQAVL